MKTRIFKENCLVAREKTNSLLGFSWKYRGKRASMENWQRVSTDVRVDLKSLSRGNAIRATCRVGQPRHSPLGASHTAIELPAEFPWRHGIVSVGQNRDIRPERAYVSRSLHPRRVCDWKRFPVLTYVHNDTYRVTRNNRFENKLSLKSLRCLQNICYLLNSFINDRVQNLYAWFSTRLFIYRVTQNSLCWNKYSKKIIYLLYIFYLVN